MCPGELRNAGDGKVMLFEHMYVEAMVKVWVNAYACTGCKCRFCAGGYYRKISYLFIEYLKLYKCILEVIKD